MNKKSIVLTVSTLITIAYYTYSHGLSRKALALLAVFFIMLTFRLFVHYYGDKRIHRTKLSFIINTNIMEQLYTIIMWIVLFVSLLLLYPSVLNYKIYNNITVENLAIAVTIFTGVYITSKTISNYVISSERNDKTIIIKMRVLHYLVVLTTFFVDLKYLGLGTALTNILLAGSITSIIVGLAAQKTIGNFIAGIILLMDKPFKIGDYIEVQGAKGFVIDIQFMSTIIKTYDEKIIRIPNEVILTERVTNYKRNKIIKITHKIGVSYDSNIDKAKEAIMKVLEEEELVLAYPRPFISVEDYADSAIIIIFWYYVPFDEWYTVPKKITEKIKKQFDKDGIKIPYPQLVVHGGEPLHVFINKNNK